MRDQCSTPRWRRRGRPPKSVMMMTTRQHITISERFILLKRALRIVSISNSWWTSLSTRSSRCLMSLSQLMAEVVGEDWEKWTQSRSARCTEITTSMSSSLTSYIAFLERTYNTKSNSSLKGGTSSNSQPCRSSISTVRVALLRTPSRSIFLWARWSTCSSSPRISSRR